MQKSTDEKFRLFFQTNPQPMIVFDRDTLELLETNDASSRMYGYSMMELRDMRITDLMSLDSPISRTEDLHHPDSALQPMEWRHRQKSGNVIDLEAMTHEIRYTRRHAVLAVLVDVTRRKQLEAQLLQAQKMEAVGMLAGGIAHDFNNLLTIINGYSQLLLSSLDQTDRNRSAVEQIMKAGDRAAALTRQLLAFSRRQTIQPRVLDLNILVGSLAVMLRRLIGEDIDLRLDLAPDTGKVNADAGKIEQIIMNLAVNSRDAMPSGGTLTIHTANMELDERYTHTQTRVKPGSYVMLEVNDTGSGMTEEIRARLFEPFFTTKSQGRGTGLGLSIVFGIVRQMGGNLEVETKPGLGTSIRVYLPRVEHVPAAETELPAPAVERGTETILLVEDDDMVRKLVRETLEHEGYKILEAADPEQAGRISRSYDGRIHLMITDVVMPQENGRSLAMRLTKQRSDMKVIYMSGYTDTSIIGMPGEWGTAEFLQKPFTPAVLARKVRTVLQQGGNGDKCRHAGG